MEKKKLLNILLSVLLLIGGVNGATFFDSFTLSFSDAKPSDMKILSYQCDDSSCSSATPVSVEYYKGDAISCWTDYGLQGDSDGFYSCMEGYKLSGNTLDLSDCSTISNGCSGDVFLFAKYENIDSASFGYVNYFYTKGDTYMANYFRQNSFNCEYDTCVDTSASGIGFVKGQDAIAEVGQLNIKNLDNELLPVQVEVPVSIEETVCSAYRFTQPDMFKPQPPSGYSDYSADTKVSLDITREDNGVSLYSQELTIPILADQCADMAAFSWTPDSSLENEDIKFRVESEVIDGQVTNSIIDWMEVIETIYPLDLDNTCWSRAYDFTLSNVPNQDMSTSVAQITKGESLYAIFSSGAWRDNTITPMNYEANMYFDGEMIYSETFSSADDVETHVVDLSDEILGLDAGSYEVKLITSPSGLNCQVSEDVEQTQNLQILEPSSYEVNFHVRDPNYDPLAGASVRFELLNADDYYQVDPVYNEVLTTNSNGNTVFDDVIPGDYKYVVSYSGYTTVTNNIHVGGPMDIYVTMDDSNSRPVINLPDEFTKYYGETIRFNINNYVSDFNDDVSDLSYTYNVVSGSANVNFDGQYFTITDNAPSQSTLEITVEDPEGARATDSTLINFIDNSAPVIDIFDATPDDGPNPLTTTFSIDVSDSDGDNLECTLDFGDGSSVSNDCLVLDGITHRYTAKGTYEAKLSVEDGLNDPVEANKFIYVYDKEATPIINYFRLDSSNGNEVPTDLTLSWDAEHNLDYPIECTLRVNGVNHDVDCSDTTFNIDDFDRTGVSRFSLVVIDNESNQEVRTIERTFVEGETPTPIINYFRLDSSNGNEVPTDLTLSWDAEHNLDYPIECSLTVNGDREVVDCSDATFNINDFDRVGLSTFTLRVTDNESNEVIERISRTFVQTVDPTPIINYFRLDSSNGNEVPTDLTLSWDAEHNLDYPIECSLTVNGDREVVDCSDATFNINDFDRVGLSTFTLRVTDNESNEVIERISRTFVEGEMPTPIINYFRLDSSNGNEVPTNLTLSWDVEHNLDYPIECSLTVNGDREVVDCSDATYNINDFDVEGLSSFSLRVTDNENNEVIQTIDREFIRPEPQPIPIINYFTLDSSNDYRLPTDLDLSWDVEHNLDYPIECTLRVNGVDLDVDCSDDFYEINNFNREGLSSFSLIVTDNESNEVVEIIERTFVQTAQPTPIINYFILESSNDLMVPTDLTLRWDAEHTLDYPMDCVLTINDENRNVSCSESSFNIDDFNVTGVSTFELRATDNESNEDSRTIEKEFFAQEDVVDKFDTRLEIDDVIEPGDFEFTIFTNNETLARRIVDVEPVIVCEGIENHLKGTQLDSSVVSRSLLEDGKHVFRSNTLDYELKVLKDTPCTFKAILTDKFGSKKVLEDNVKFSYATDNETFASIRGKGTDIMDYMDSTLIGDGMNRGYNTIEFIVANHEDKTKELSISMISQSLGIQQRTQVNINSDQERRVVLPVYVRESTQSGMYPVRYTINDQENTQTRYSYIKIN
jgi:hypothetical protein